MQDEHSRQSRLALRAGRAVGNGALLAGPLTKRSEWLHSWNRRFCVLTTEALSWHGDSGPGGPERSVRMHSGMRLIARDGTLLLQPGPDAAGALWFSAASEAELRVWHKTLRAHIDALQAEGRVARLHVRENGSRFAAPPFEERPHAGSRSLREGRLSKPYFTCGTEPQRGHVGGVARGATRQSGAPQAGDVLVYTLDLPPSAAGWCGERRRAFRELLVAIGEVRTLAPVLHASLGRLPSSRPSPSPSPSP